MATEMKYKGNAFVVNNKIFWLILYDFFNLNCNIIMQHVPKNAHFLN